MAFSKTPQISTYSTKRLEFHGVDSRRDVGSDRDIAMVNCFYDRFSQENKEREVVVAKRPGLDFYTQFNLLQTMNVFTTIQNSSNSRQIFVGQTQTIGNAGVNLLVAFTDNTFYQAINVGGGSTFGAGFYGTELLRNNGTVEYIFVYGNQLYRLDTNLHNIGAVVTLPFNAANFCVAIDGYVFTAEFGTNKLRASALDNPTDWTTLPDPQLAESSPDPVAMLSKVGNYLVVFGTQSTEFFYNSGVGNEFPFRRQSGYAQSIGFSTQLAADGDDLYFVGNAVGGGLGVFLLKDFKIERISTPALERRLVFGTVEQGSILKASGHSWYIVQTNNETWAYDTDTKLWSVWTNAYGGNLDISVAVTPPNYGSSIVIGRQRGGAQFYYFQGYRDFSYNAARYQDYKVEYTTGPQDFGSMNYKTINRLGFVGEPWFPMTSPYNVGVSWSDNSTGTWTTPRTINLASTSPFITRCGRFRRRNFKLSYLGTLGVWWKGLEFEINSGVK